MVIDIPTKAGEVPDLKQRDVRETPTAILTAAEAVPIGAILAWLKSFTGTPAMPTGFVECNGQVLNDVDSVYNGETIPDLNGNEFLRGAATSGGTGGGTTGAGSAHTHTQNGSVSADSHSHNDTFATGNESSHTHSIPSIAEGVEFAGENYLLTGQTSGSGSAHNHSVTGSVSADSHSHNDTFSNANESAHTHASQPKYYNVVWIMRVK